MANKPKSTPKPAASEKEVVVPAISQGAATFCVFGRTPLIFNRMAAKSKRSLLMPSRRMNEAEKAANMKHDPLTEYRDSVYRNPGDTPPTRLKLPIAAFKGAMKTAALDMPGSRRTEIGRCVSMEEVNVDIYGVPKLKMDVVRMADINHTPDIRTRAALPEWAAMVTITFIQPKLRLQSVINLFSGGGVISGVGDWRQEKGSGNYGMFRVVDKSDPDFQRVLKSGTRAAQDRALERPECYDEETQELFDWYYAEILLRGREAA